jgi:hypothetical protein
LTSPTTARKNSNSPTGKNDPMKTVLLTTALL